MPKGALTLCLATCGKARMIKVKQVITKDGKVFCTTTVPYPTAVIKEMKKAGFKIKEEN